MKIALLEFGTFSNFNKVMSNHISLFENNIIQLNKFFNHSEIEFDIYILTDKTRNYTKCVSILQDMLMKYNITLKLLHFWDDLKETYHEMDLRSNQNYIDIFNIAQYGYNDTEHPYGYDNKKEFNAGNLWFRRYLNFHLFNEYNKINQNTYDFICLTRLFSTKMIAIKELHHLDKDCLYYAIDTFFMGNYSTIEKLLHFGRDSLFYNINNHDNKPILLDNTEFIKFSILHDSCIGTHIFSSEIQILYYIYSNFKNIKNLRFNFCAHLDNQCICDLIYNDIYDDSDLIKSIFNKEDCHLYISISR